MEYLWYDLVNLLQVLVKIKVLMPNKLPLLDFAKSYQHRTQNLEMFSAQRRKGNSKKHSDKASSPDDGQQKDAENTKVQVQVEESCSQGQCNSSLF